MHATKLWVLVLCSLTLACGEVVKATDGGVDPSGDGGATGGCDSALDSAASFSACLAEKRCAWMVRCTARYADHEQCLEASETEPELGYVNQLIGLMLIEGAEAGAFAIDESLMEACLESFGSASCKGDDAGGGGEACELSIEGLRGEGDSCYEDLECGRGGRCDSQGCGFGTCCLGTCRLPVADGQSCGGEIVCESGLACVDGRCESGALDAPCAIDGDCDEGLHCEGTCKPNLAEGDPCERDGMCEGDLQCVDQRCLPTSSDGDACNDDCFGAFYCDAAAGRCRPVPRAAGAECAAAQVCLGNELHCNQQTGRCETLPGRDEECTPRGRCGPGLVCADDSAPTRCIEPLAEGEPCTRAGTCATFHCAPESDTCEALESCYGP